MVPCCEAWRSMTGVCTARETTRARIPLAAFGMGIATVGVCAAGKRARCEVLLQREA